MRSGWGAMGRGDRIFTLRRGSRGAADGEIYEGRRGRCAAVPEDVSPGERTEVQTWVPYIGG